MNRRVWQVEALNPTRMVWTVWSEHDNEGDANEHAEALWHRHRSRLQVRVRPGLRAMVGVKPAVVNASTVFRRQQAQQMSDLADANKRYKSPG